MAKFGHKDINREIQQAMGGGGQPNLMARMLDSVRSKMGGQDDQTGTPPTGIPDAAPLRGRGGAGELRERR